LQVFSGGWRTAIECFRVRLNAQSRAAALFVYLDRRVIGLGARVRASFPGDVDHLAAKSGWAYFRVTT
jgi:hypothetical protein